MRRSTRILLEYAVIAVGALLIALALQCFLVPNKISSGGVGSIAMILFHTIRLPLSVSNVAINLLLLLFGYRFLGRSMVMKTIFGIAALSVWLELFRTVPTYTGDLTVSALLGGCMLGIGLGCVVRCNASTGGSDFFALILHRFFSHLSVAHLILWVDCGIILLSGIVFRSITVTAYSLLSLVVASKITDFIVSFGDLAKSVLILSEKSGEIADCILQKFSRGVTAIYSKGMYSGKDRPLLLCVVSPKELPRLIQTIRRIDSVAFIIISDVREVLGEGFKGKTPHDPPYPPLSGK